MDCAHWQPEQAPKGMASLGYSPCAIRSISKGHTFSSHTSCEMFKAAAGDTAEKRRKFLMETE